MNDPTLKEESDQPKKKKNRWGSPQGNVNEVLSENTIIAPPVDAKLARKSRWSDVSTAEPTPSVQQIITPHEVAQQTMILKLQLQRINEKLLSVVQDAAQIEKDPCRSPSPPPRYDSCGKRTNTRELRMRETLSRERIQIIEEILQLNPQYVPPADFIKGKPVRRIYIPKQVNPLYNYIGLIIGPRGNTQKQMEQETNCKISIRGKGSSKEGSKGRASKNVDEDDELHVHITGDEEEKVEQAARMVEELLKPVDENINLHKQKQLRELALINGTLREDEFCPICGEKGHRQFECPHRAKAFKSAGVKCSICGDLSHPTRDCPMKLDAPSNEAVIDNEYDSFLSELSGKEAPVKSAQGLSAVGASIASSGVTSLPNNGRAGPIMVAPIVDMLSRKPQTIITVTSVMTGSAPPVFSTSAPLPIYGTTTAASSTPALPGVPLQYTPGITQAWLAPSVIGVPSPVYAPYPHAAVPVYPPPPSAPLPPIPPVIPPTNHSSLHNH